jgi:hypothetical protein
MKEEGCDRITCIICKISMCFICHKFFDVIEDCYDHISEEHPDNEFNEINKCMRILRCVNKECK